MQERRRGGLRSTPSKITLPPILPSNSLFAGTMTRRVSVRPLASCPTTTPPVVFLFPGTMTRRVSVNPLASQPTTTPPVVFLFPGTMTRRGAVETPSRELPHHHSSRRVPSSQERRRGGLGFTLSRVALPPTPPLSCSLFEGTMPKRGAGETQSRELPYHH